MHRVAALLLCCALAVCAAAVAAPSPAAFPGWGTIKGRVVFDGKSIPANPDVAITTDRKYCLSKGPIKRNELVVNPRNKGVRWVLVWLAPVKGFADPANVPPIHPVLNKVPAKLEITIICCVYEPRVAGLREGTPLVFKDANAVLHHTKIEAPWAVGWSLVPARKERVIKNAKARLFPFSCCCTIHPWMKGWVGVFKHPYHAVTDADGHFEIKNAPAGKWRLITWQEKVGWVDFKSKDNIGRIITIKGKGTTTETVLLKDEV
jgi:hypothetical protein